MLSCFMVKNCLKIENWKQEITAKPEYDAVIVGAGPAGAVSAAILAARSWRVLLIDRAIFPREKTCGGCVNARAIQTLRELGLQSALNSAATIIKYDLRVREHRLSSPIPAGVAISRSELDSALVTEAQKRGCDFLPGTSAVLCPTDPGKPFRQLILRNNSGSQTIAARIVLACDGIAGTLLDSEPRAAWKTTKNPWLGISTLLEPGNAILAAGTIQMNVAEGGYVGLVKLSDGRIHMGAALDPRACRKAGTATALIRKILSDCLGPRIAGLEKAKFFGVGRYTRRRTYPGAHRVLAVGDAIGYVEPFTGEGIAWAVCSAREATALLPDPDADWPECLVQSWAKRHHIIIGRGQWLCRALRYMVRHPNLASAAVAFASAFPTIPVNIAFRIGQPDSPLHAPV